MMRGPRSRSRSRSQRAGRDRDRGDRGDREYWRGRDYGVDRNHLGDTDDRRDRDDPGGRGHWGGRDDQSDRADRGDMDDRGERDYRDRRSQYRDARDADSGHERGCECDRDDGDGREWRESDGCGRGRDRDRRDSFIERRPSRGDARDERRRDDGRLARRARSAERDRSRGKGDGKEGCGKDAWKGGKEAKTVNLETFIKESGIDASATEVLRKASPVVIAAIIEEGVLGGRNPSSLVIKRIKDLRAEKGNPIVAKTPAKTVLCRHIARGHCWMGEACKFRHDINENDDMEVWKALGVGGPALNIPCRHFSARGFCQLGEACRFSHDAQHAAPAMVVPPKFGVLAAMVPQSGSIEPEPTIAYSPGLSHLLEQAGLLQSKSPAVASNLAWPVQSFQTGPSLEHDVAALQSGPPLEVPQLPHMTEEQWAESVQKELELLGMGSAEPEGAPPMEMFFPGDIAMPTNASLGLLHFPGQDVDVGATLPGKLLIQPSEPTPIILPGFAEPQPPTRSLSMPKAPFVPTLRIASLSEVWNEPAGAKAGPSGLAGKLLGDAHLKLQESLRQTQETITTSASPPHASPLGDTSGATTSLNFDGSLVTDDVAAAVKARAAAVAVAAREGGGAELHPKATSSAGASERERGRPAAAPTSVPAWLGDLDLDRFKQGGAVSTAPLPRNYKTILCRHFQSGFCRMRDDCKFIHERGYAPPFPDKALRDMMPHPSSKTKLCTHFEKGVCPRSAEHCNYAHGARELRPAPDSAQAWQAPGPVQHLQPATMAPADGPELDMSRLAEEWRQLQAKRR